MASLSGSLFNFELDTKIHFGIGALEHVGAEFDERGWRSALIVTDRGVREAGLLARVEEHLRISDISYEVYDGVVPDATVESIEAARAPAEEHDALIALGGGSSIDTAKALNVLRTHGGGVLDWEGNDTIPGLCGPLVAIPTTAGTGSEVTFIAQIHDAGRKQKLPIVSRFLAAEIAIVDPELSATMPPRVTAATGMDALTHAIEAATSIAEQPLSDLLAFRAVSLINESLPKAVQNGSDLEARAGMAFASLIAGIAFNNAWVALAHAIAHALGGLYDLPHGLCCALTLPAAMEFNLEAKPDKYAKIAELLGQSDAAAGVARVKELNRHLGIPSSLGELDVPEGDAEKIAELAMADGSVLFNPRPVADEEILSLVRSLY